MTFIAAHERRGQPLLFLGLLVLGWVLIRVVTWEAPWPDAIKLTNIHQLPAEPEAGQKRPANNEAALRSSEMQNALSGPLTRMVRSNLLKPGPNRLTPLDAVNATNDEPQASVPLPFVAVAGSMKTGVSGQASSQPAHTLSPDEFDPEGSSRWRLDGWLYLRDGATGASEGGTRPVSYGASQAGMVLSFRLKDGVRAYARATHALVPDGDSEAALGLSIRPFPTLPVTAHVEGRARRHELGTELRPSAFLAGGMDRVTLPFDFKGSAYTQVGVVGGDFATAFVDGSVRLERPVARFDLGEIRVGAGGWGGAQRDAERLDFGPSIVIVTQIAEAPVRVETDYRIRVAGRAEPGSGLTLTVIGGF